MNSWRVPFGDLFRLQFSVTCSWQQSSQSDKHNNCQDVSFRKEKNEKRVRKENPKRTKKKQCNSTCKINSKSQPCPILHSDFENHRYLRRHRSGPGVPIKANVNIVLNKNKCILGEQKHVHKFQFWFDGNCLAQTLSVTTTWTCRCWPFGTATLD